MMASPASRTIEPGEADWFLDGATLIMAARVAVDADACILAGIPHGQDYDFHDPSSASRFYKYRAGKWVCTEVSTRISSMMLYTPPGWTHEGLAILCENGQLIFMGDDLFTSQVEAHDAPPFGRLHVFQDKLYASASRGQLLRQDPGGWVHDDAGMLGIQVSVPKPPTTEAGIFTAKDYVVGTECYACGSVYVGRSALLWRPAASGAHWQNVDLGRINGADGTLSGLFLQRPDTIWIACTKGYLLRGSGSAGFEIATDTHIASDGRPNRFTNVVEYRGELYAGGTEACHVGRDGHLEPLLGPPAAEMDWHRTLEPEPEVLSPLIRGYLDVVDGVMWAIDWGMLSRFDGTRWTRIAMPSVYHRG